MKRRSPVNPPARHLRSVRGGASPDMKRRITEARKATRSKVTVYFREPERRAA